MSNATIHVAYSVSRRHGGTSYWAKAAVTQGGSVSYHTTGIGDTAAEAVDDALGYIFGIHRREGTPPPKTTILYGRVPRVDIETVSFVKRH